VFEVGVAAREAVATAAAGEAAEAMETVEMEVAAREAVEKVGIVAKKSDVVRLDSRPTPAPRE
jgi:hypothetical protein